MDYFREFGIDRSIDRKLYSEWLFALNFSKGLLIGHIKKICVSITFFGILIIRTTSYNDIIIDTYTITIPLEHLYQSILQLTLYNNYNSN